MNSLHTAASSDSTFEKMDRHNTAKMTSSERVSIPNLRLSVANIAALLVLSNLPRFFLPQRLSAVLQSRSHGLGYR